MCSAKVLPDYWNSALLLGTMSTLLHAHHISKNYGDVSVLNDISLEVETVNLWRLRVHPVQESIHSCIF